MADAVDQAIAATEAPATPRASVRVRLPSGREIIVNAPIDMTAEDALGLVGFVAGGLAGEPRKARPSSRLVVARGAVPRA